MTIKFETYPLWHSVVLCELCVEKRQLGFEHKCSIKVYTNDALISSTTIRTGILFMIASMLSISNTLAVRLLGDAKNIKTA
jgi:hypothetical protein